MILAMRYHRLALLLLALPAAARAQIAIGDRPRVTGLRINFRDRRLEEVKGVNATIWFPYDPPSGVVRGVVIGGLGVGAPRISGGALGVFNRVSGTQHGLTVGVVNYARELHGAQVGLVNIVNGPRGRRVIPVINVGR